MHEELVKPNYPLHQPERECLWCLQLSVEEACTKCRHSWMREALQMWLQQRGSANQQGSNLEPQANGVPVAS